MDSGASFQLTTTNGVVTLTTTAGNTTINTSGTVGGSVQIDTTTGAIVWNGTGAADQLVVSDHTVDYSTYVGRNFVCTQLGHMMTAETEDADGTISGSCEMCGEAMRGRRIVGGLVLQAIEELVAEGMDGNPEALAEEILLAEQRLEAERAQLERAESALRLAKALLVQ